MSVLLYSSGLDSELHRLTLNPDKLLFFRSGASYQEMEELQIDKFVRCGMIPKEQVVFEEDVFNFATLEDDNKVVPMRNIFYILRAFEHSEDVIIGVTHYDLHYDKQQRTLHDLEGFVRNYYYGRQVPDTWESIHPQIHTPFFELTKGELLMGAIDQGCDVGHIPTLRTCYDANSEKGCGKCDCCLHKAIALAVNDMFSPDLFDSDPRKVGKDWLSLYMEISRDIIDEKLFRREVDIFLGS